ncbi:MAG: hypothetical protein BGP16_11535 [Sphingobium sp. 66-54]|nr:MAG: hypothetical protein BGP16_11535 [Sphingobium sp. 66-54]
MDRTVLFVAAAAATASPLHAQATRGASDIVVTATRAPVPLERQPYSVTVLGADALAASESIADALARLPEVYVQMSGGRTGFASLFLRGADPNFTTVMLEGVPLDSPTNSRGGAVNLAAVPSAAIARVEMVSGPASTLYGSGPLAGAVNLLLAPPAAHHRFSASGSLGSEGDYSAAGQWQGPVAAGFGGSLTGVIDDAGTALPQSRFRSRSVDLRLARLDGARGSLLVHFAHTRSAGFPDSSGGYDHAVIRSVERRKADEIILAADQTLLRAGPATLSLAASWSSRDDRVASPGVAPSAETPTGVPGGLDDIRYRRGIIRPDVSVDLGAWRATAGVQGQWETARSEGYLDFGFHAPTSYRQTRATYSGFAELNGTLGPLEANGGVRIDDVEGIGARWSGRAGLRYAVGGLVSVRAVAGTAFKAPSFYALGNPFVGNPALRPERATAMELGLDWRPSEADHVSVAVFRTRYRDLIDFVPAHPPRLENRARVTSRGVSAQLSHRLGEALKGSFTVQYVETQDAATGIQLLNRPRWRAGADLEWAPVKTLTMRAHYDYTDERDDYAVPTGVQVLGRTHRLSTSVAWTVARHTRLRLEGENLLQDRGQDAIGFPALPRRVRLTLTHSIE